MIIRITSGLVEDLHTLAAAGLPEEVCGLLLGHDDMIDRSVPARNIAPDPRRRFEIDPATLLATHRTAREQGLRVIGHYHSHPDGRAEPSARDAARAVDNGQLWLIITQASLTGWMPVPAGTPGAVHGRFSSVHLEVQ